MLQQGREIIHTMEILRGKDWLCLASFMEFLPWGGTDIYMAILFLLTFFQIYNINTNSFHMDTLIQRPVLKKKKKIPETN